MSVARGGSNGRAIYSNIVKPWYLTCNFIVDSTNGNGLGLRSLKSNGFVQNVFMHTTQTPGVSNGQTNPNPLAGFAQIQFKQNFNAYLGGFTGFVSPVTGSIKIDNSAMTIGQVYVISTLGNATLAKWNTIGVPAGVTPAVGVTFVALTNGGAGNTLTSRVSTPSVSGTNSVEVIGDPNTMINNSSIATNSGAFVFVQFLTASGSGTVAAPVFTGTVMDTHTHNFTVIGGQAGSTTNNIANYAGPLIGKQEATNATYLGANSATNGGVVAASAGTPAGTNSAPAFTSTSAMAAANPADGSVVGMTFFFDGSSVTIDGL